MVDHRESGWSGSNVVAAQRLPPHVSRNTCTDEPDSYTETRPSRNCKLGGAFVRHLAVLSGL